MLAGTDEKAIISVVAYRSNTQRQQIKQKFKSMYGKVSRKEFKYNVLALCMGVGDLRWQVMWDHGTMNSVAPIQLSLPIILCMYMYMYTVCSTSFCLPRFVSTLKALGLIAILVLQFS